MRFLVVLLALVVALALQTTLAGLRIGGVTLVNLVLIVVVYVGLAFGPAGGLATGTIGGLIQDGLAGGIVGIGGFAKTLVGFFVGLLGAQFIVSQTLPRLVMFFGATMAHELCYQALSALVDSRPFSMNYTATLTQAAVNAVIGVMAFQIVERGPAAVQRRRSRGASLGRRNF